ncbi:retinoblastoma-like protein 2 isoform X3 [Oncorhynchus keta]|uniref:retinoblastoma-like protein 2 isoform X3 n=1 Tax=Oncorhynchus keta TaxID=8018 RepID=UPI00227AB5E7|nr:retinoblastoma-like protein 2 isoform X3 [Oncorhynchus keta]
MATQRHVPSDSLARTFRSCARNPSEVISTRLRDMLHTFIQHYQEPWEENHSRDRERGVKFSSQTEALYYRVLEAVINQERKRLGAKNILGILEHDLSQRSLVACCLEMVIFSHQPPGSFPLVIDIFSLAPYDFYKVIELVLRAEEGLLPGVVRHLTHIEEQVLESLAWRRDSPLWDQIRAAKGQGQLPAYHQVMLPQYSEDTDKMAKIPPTPSHLTSSLVNGIHGIDLNSPITHHERYSSPPAGSKMAACPTTPVSPSQSSSVIVTGQTVVTMASATVTTNNGQSVSIPVRDVDPSSSLLTYQSPPTHPTGPRAPCRPDQEERGHLIYFYNTVYVKQMKDFALRYTSSSLTIAGSLREISDMMKTFQSRTRKCCAAQLQEDGEEEGGPLAKRPCQDRPSNLQRKLRDFDQALMRAQNQQQAQTGAKATAHNGTH